MTELTRESIVRDLEEIIINKHGYEKNSQIGHDYYLRNSIADYILQLLERREKIAFIEGFQKEKINLETILERERVKIAQEIYNEFLNSVEKDYETNTMLMVMKCRKILNIKDVQNGK